jgi:hypothetical protein
LARFSHQTNINIKNPPQKYLKKGFLTLKNFILMHPMDMRRLARFSHLEEFYSDASN